MGEPVIPSAPDCLVLPDLDLNGHVLQEIVNPRNHTYTIYVTAITSLRILSSRDKTFIILCIPHYANIHGRSSALYMSTYEQELYAFIIYSVRIISTSIDLRLINPDISIDDYREYFKLLFMLRNGPGAVRFLKIYTAYNSTMVFVIYGSLFRYIGCVELSTISLASRGVSDNLGRMPLDFKAARPIFHATDSDPGLETAGGSQIRKEFFCGVRNPFNRAWISHPHLPGLGSETPHRESTNVPMGNGSCVTASHDQFFANKPP